MPGVGGVVQKLQSYMWPKFKLQKGVKKIRITSEAWLEHGRKQRIVAEFDIAPLRIHTLYFYEVYLLV